VAEQIGGGPRTRRTFGFWVVVVLAVAVWALLVFAHGRTVWFSISGPVVPVQVVGCQGSPHGSTCTGVWRPTGEPEKTVTIHGDIWALKGETVNVRIHGDDAWATTNNRELSRAEMELGFWGIGGLIVIVVSLVAFGRRKSAL